MITKILLTIAVVLASLTVLRHRQQPRVVRREGATKSTRPMIAVVGFVLFTLILSALLYYHHWAEQHALFTVEVINSHNGRQSRYRVYRQDIGQRSFRTVDGRVVNLADSERMEVEGL